MAKSKARKQGKHSRPRGSARQPLETEQAVSGSVCEPPRPLQNLGNTCFFNATIQALVSAPAMQEHFSNLEFSTPACMSFKDWVVSSTAAAGETRAHNLPQKPRVYTSFSTAPGSKKSKGAYNPQRLHAAVAARFPQFKVCKGTQKCGTLLYTAAQGRQQQDAQELLTALLDLLAEPGTDVRACTPRSNKRGGKLASQPH